MRSVKFLALALLAVAEAQDVLPSITLPWGTWQALNDTTSSLWHIPNIRFGQDTKNSRFSGPLVPTPIANSSQIMNSSYGPACIQVPIPTCSSTSPGGAVPIPRIDPDNQSEDCLFLDVYIPKSVDMSKPTTPVIVWIYGGAFVFGSKGNDEFDSHGPFYSGNGIIEAAEKLSPSASEVIFVTGNYRLGAFGWLAGPTMQSLGLPNAGIYDQSAVFAWVQQYIAELGGDPDNISAWGESAGASSIMHHLVQQDGKPLPFRTAFVQSPAFEWQWDNSANGTLEGIFNEFAAGANCEDGNSSAVFTCLQNADVGSLTDSSNALFNKYNTRGMFPFGPSVDDMSFPYLAPIALESGKFKALDRLMVSHVYNESGSFTPPHTSTDADYTTFVTDFVPNDTYPGIDQQIINQYPLSNYKDEFDRLSHTIRDVSFTCNTRYLYDAYANIAKVPVYMMQYSLGADDILLETHDPARHASDLLSTFWSAEYNMTDFLFNSLCVKPKFAAGYFAGLVHGAAPNYQTYLANYLLAGAPGQPAGWPTWQEATNDPNSIMNVLDFHATAGTSNPGYVDDQNTWDYCGFWLNVSQQLQATVQSRGEEFMMDGGYERPDQKVVTIQDPDYVELK